MICPECGAPVKHVGVHLNLEPRYKLDFKKAAKDYCGICAEPLDNGYTIIGIGTGDGNRFAHRKCYDRLRQ
jgi:hypothetical protein